MIKGKCIITTTYIFPSLTQRLMRKGLDYLIWLINSKCLLLFKCEAGIIWIALDSSAWRYHFWFVKLLRRGWWQFVGTFQWSCFSRHSCGRFAKEVVLFVSVVDVANVVKYFQNTQSLESFFLKYCHNGSFSTFPIWFAWTQNCITGALSPSQEAELHLPGFTKALS